MMRRKFTKIAISHAAAVVTLAIIAAALASAAQAQSLPITSERSAAAFVFRQAISDGGVAEETDVMAEKPARLRRQIVDYAATEPPGTIIVDTPNTYLYYVLGGGKAIRYGIGVGREGFTWSGVRTVERKTEWPDWYPPAEMVARQPYLPRFIAGGPGNPLGARAMYIAGTVYRIHGTNAPETIGKQVSSGCIRRANEDVIDLYNRVNVGAKVVVLPMTHAPVIQHRVAQPQTLPPVQAAVSRRSGRSNGAGLY